MRQNNTGKTLEQMLAAIEALDLEPVKAVLMDHEDGHGWTNFEADRHEREYKRFLALLVKFPDEVIAPTPEIDRFWHAHILDTMKYAADCRNVFGYFLHHTPARAVERSAHGKALAAAVENLRRLYRQEFGRSEFPLPAPARTYRIDSRIQPRIFGAIHPLLQEAHQDP